MCPACHSDAEVDEVYAPSLKNALVQSAVGPWVGFFLLYLLVIQVWNPVETGSYVFAGYASFTWYIDAIFTIAISALVMGHGVTSLRQVPEVESLVSTLWKPTHGWAVLSSGLTLLAALAAMVAQLLF